MKSDFSFQKLIYRESEKGNENIILRKKNIKCEFSNLFMQEFGDIPY
jgi:hypothetical protein